MAKRNPTMAELMVGTPSSSSRNVDEGMEKAAAQAQVGEVFEAMTKEAKEDIIGTLSWGGRAFGEQCGEGAASKLEPVLFKLAELVQELKVALLSNQEGAQPHKTLPKAPPGNTGGLPTDSKRPNTGSDKANVKETATKDNEEVTPGSTGWPTQAAKKRLATAKVVEQVKGASASHFLANLKKEKEEKHEGKETPAEEKKEESCKVSSLAEIGQRFGEMLRSAHPRNQ